MAEVALFTAAAPAPGDALGSLGLLHHHVHVHPLSVRSLPALDDIDAVLVDGTGDLAAARDVCTALRSEHERQAILLIVTEGGISAVSADWGVSDIVLTQATPAEVEARIRLLTQRARRRRPQGPGELRAAELTIDQAGYSARVHGDPLDLTYKEFELLRYLMQHPNQVFTRGQLLHEVWGYDYFGGTRTVDVHVRRLRAKLGPDHESLIGTVRNVGYRFNQPRAAAERASGDIR